MSLPSRLVDSDTGEILELKRVEALTRRLMHICGLDRSCLNCEHFDKQNELCLLGNVNARPPAKVIAQGCPAWEEEIPF